MFNRINLIQRFIDRLDAKSYMEIGVFNGYSFLNIKCKRKLGIDPKFLIKSKEKFKAYFKNPSNFLNEYYTMTSDDFFTTHVKKINSFYPKVIFIDGLHTFEQTLQDCYNSLNYLAEGGVIILHDCNPPSAASSTPALSIPEAEQIWKAKNNTGWTDEWCGDTWKTIPFLIKNNPELNVSVLNTDYGLGVVSKKRTQKNTNYTMPNNIDEFKSLSFSELELDPVKMLNLIQLNELEGLINLHTK
ncbi:MAG: class I SAM-dependent methyltransferase [Candidatus Marinimicrobia bacterium]|nr:class I SAM-dependent methyltransferase [Candidatus Neomarinimicrobiota bacterium]